MVASMSQRTVVPDGSKIATLRKNMLWTQRDLADSSHCSKRTIENCEAGIPVFVATVQLIAQALKVRPEELIIPNQGAAGGTGDYLRGEPL